jgi:pilus assembly protein CpaB
MKPKTLILLVVAVGCGLGASFMTSRYLAKQGEQKPAEKTIPVLVAKQRVPPFKQLNQPQQYFEVKPVPESVAPKEPIAELEKVKGKMLSKEVNEGAFLTKADLFDEKTDKIAGRLGKGERGIAIKVNAESLVGGFVFPGSRVDVISTIRGGIAKSRTILQDKLVLAVGDVIARDPNQPSILAATVTLACTPEEGQRLALAGSQGELRLALRKPGDNSTVRLGETTPKDLEKPLQKQPKEIDSELPPALVGTSPIPLPPVKPGTEPDTKEPAPLVKQTDPRFEAHIMKIVNGPFRSRAVFLKNSTGGWQETDPEDPEQLRKAISNAQKEQQEAVRKEQEDTAKTKTPKTTTPESESGDGSSAP